MPDPTRDLHVAFPDFDTTHYCTCGWHLASQCGACDCCKPKPPPDRSWLSMECVCCGRPEHVSRWGRFREWWVATRREPRMTTGRVVIRQSLPPSQRPVPRPPQPTLPDPSRRGMR